MSNDSIAICDLINKYMKIDNINNGFFSEYDTHLYRKQQNKWVSINNKLYKSFDYPNDSIGDESDYYVLYEKTDQPTLKSIYQKVDNAWKIVNIRLFYVDVLKDSFGENGDISVIISTITINPMLKLPFKESTEESSIWYDNGIYFVGDGKKVYEIKDSVEQSTKEIIGSILLSNKTYSSSNKQSSIKPSLNFGFNTMGNYNFWNDISLPKRK